MACPLHTPSKWLVWQVELLHFQVMFYLVSCSSSPFLLSFSTSSFSLLFLPSSLSLPTLFTSLHSTSSLPFHPPPLPFSSLLLPLFNPLPTLFQALTSVYSSAALLSSHTTYTATAMNTPLRTTPQEHASSTTKKTSDGSESLSYTSGCCSYILVIRNKLWFFEHYFVVQNCHVRSKCIRSKYN